jgi:hypothetical protein
MKKDERTSRAWACMAWLVVCGALAGAGRAQGERAGGRDAVDVIEVVQRLTLDRAMTLAAAQHRFEEQDRARLAQLAEKDRRLRASLKAGKLAGAELGRVRGELSALTAEREKLVAELSRRDSAFAAELAEYRKLLGDSAKTASEARRRELQRYADGDRTAATDAMLELTEIERKARDKASQMLAAAEDRQTAALMADQKDRGERTSQQVLAVWRRANGRDPGDFWNWVFVARLEEVVPLPFRRKGHLRRREAHRCEPRGVPIVLRRPSPPLRMWYAGAYVFGRCRHRKQPDGRNRAEYLPPKEWLAFLDESPD